MFDLVPFAVDNVQQAVVMYPPSMKLHENLHPCVYHRTENDGRRQYIHDTPPEQHLNVDDANAAALLNAKL